MKKITLSIIALLIFSITKAQNTQEVNWWKSQKIFIGGSLGFGWSNKIDLHMEHTTSINGMPSIGSDPTMMNSGLFTFSGALSYYPSKYLSFHIKGNQQSHKIDDIEGQDGKSFMSAASFQTKINLLHKEKELGVINNIYIGGGIGSYSFNFWRKDGNTKTEVLYNSSIGPNVVVGAESIFLNKDNAKTNFSFYMEFTCDIVAFNFKSAKENNQNITMNNLAFDDWKKMSGTAFSFDFGMRFSLFNKKLPIVFK
jgi:hypothetical protein